MKRNEPVASIMSKDVITAHTGMKISDVRKLMLEHEIHHCPVVSGDELIGLLSASDILGLTVQGVGTDQRSMDSYLDFQFTIEDQMTKEVRTVSNSATIRESAELLADGKFHALPVIQGKKLVGIVTTTDLIQYLIDQY